MNDAEKEVPGCCHKPRAHICLKCYREILKSKQDEIERLTARNKELEKQTTPTIEGVPWYDFVSGLQKKISELESKLAAARERLVYARRFLKKSEHDTDWVDKGIAELGENINQKGEVK